MTTNNRELVRDGTTGQTDALPIVAVLIPNAMRRQILSAEAESKLEKIARVLSPSGDTISPGDLQVLESANACLTGWGTPPLSDQLLQNCTGLGLIAHTAGSIRRLISENGMTAGVRVSHAAAVIADAVAEHVLTVALLSIRPVHTIDRQMKTGGEWGELKDRYPGRLLAKQTIGIVGAGYVGRKVIRLFKALGCRVLVTDPFIDEPHARELGVEISTLKSLFEDSDIVSLHAPALPETTGMVGREELKTMRNGSVLINAARAALVDEEALLGELQDGRISAMLDVFDEEPLSVESPLRRLDNTLITPHSAGRTIDTYLMQGQAMVDEIQRFFEHQPLKHEVTLEMRASMA